MMSLLTKQPDLHTHRSQTTKGDKQVLLERLEWTRRWQEQPKECQFYCGHNAANLYGQQFIMCGVSMLFKVKHTTIFRSNSAIKIHSAFLAQYASKEQARKCMSSVVFINLYRAAQRCTQHHYNYHQANQCTALCMYMSNSIDIVTKTTKIRPWKTLIVVAMPLSYFMY